MNNHKITGVYAKRCRHSPQRRKPGSGLFTEHCQRLLEDATAWRFWAPRARRISSSSESARRSSRRH